MGIVGAEDDPANLLYAAAPAVALTGALLAQLRPSGLSRAMLAAAAKQGLVFAIVLALGLGFTGPLTVFFASSWLAAASLFRKAAGG